MTHLYLYLLIAICIGLLGWGLIRLERVYQYPFFMGSIFVSFILPQAIALINHPGPVSQQALERVLLMACLCAAMCWLGYQLPPNDSLLNQLDISVNNKKLLHGGIIFVLIGYVSAFLIYQLPEAELKTTTWTGPLTIYAFFVELVFPGFTIILLSTLKRPNIEKIILLAFASALPIQTIILYGRREPTATFILTIGLSLYYFRRYIPPRWLVIAMIAIALLVIPLTSNYRSIATTGNWGQLLDLQPVENLHSFIEKGQILELRNAALLMDASVKTGQYGYGTDYWNTLVFRFIPAQIVGYDLKNSLNMHPHSYQLKTLYNYSIPIGSTPTGIADSFIQFDYFGCLFFAFLGVFFKNIWVSAVDRKNTFSQILYISLISPAMISVTHGTVGFAPDLLFYCIFLGTLIVYSRDTR